MKFIFIVFYVGLKRSGKSCRLRWMNYLRPNLKHGNISADEERIIVELHEKWGNRYMHEKYTQKLIQDGFMHGT